MSNRKPKSKKEMVEDVVKDLLKWIFVSLFGFAYWMGVLFLASIFLMNIWITTWEKLLHYGIVLGVITSVVYAGILIYRKFK